MATRVVEGKKPYTGGKAIEIDENKVISLNLRDENNLIIYDEGDDEIYVDLQLKDGIRPTDAFPVGITTGRVLVADDWDITGTLICAKTTSGDNIKLLYGDDGTLWIDNGTGTFKQIYFKSDVDQLLQNLRTYVNQQLALKQDKLVAGDNISIDPTTNTISADIPPLSRFLSLWDCETGLPLSFPASVPFDYVTGDHYLVETVGTTNYRPSGSRYDGTASTTVETDTGIAVGDTYIYDGTVWLLQKNSGGVVSFANIAGQPTDNTALANALNAKANATDVNTKTFYLSGTGSSATVLAEAQAVYDWYVAGKNPIIMYNNVAYILSSISTSLAYFKSSNTTTTVVSSASSINQFMIAFSINNGDVTEVTSTSAGMVTNILKTNVNYSTPYTPTYDGSPATKKYVDDRDTYIGSSAPTSNLVEGRLWYDTTNDQLKVYDGTNWNVTGAESNTKTFYLAGTTGTTNIATAQAAYDWYAAGKNPIVVYDGANYTYYQASSSSIYFAGNKYSYSTTSSGTTTQYYYVRFTLSSGTVTGIYTGTYGMGGKYLTTDNTASYTPSGNYNPATKKYVDDRMATRLEGKIYYLDASETNLGISSDTMGEICGTLDGGAVILMMNISSTYSTMRDGYYYVTKYIEQGDADDTYDIYAVNFGEAYEDQICKVHIVITGQMSDASIDEFDVSYVFRSDGSASGKTLVKSGTGVNNYGWQRPGAYNSTTAPASPSKGTLWRDRTNNVVKLYDGSSWQTYYPSNAPIQVVSALPATPNASTVYIVTS